MTHCEQVLAYLKTGRDITPLEALANFGCLRLGARIFDLKARGYNISRRMVEVPTRHGTLARVASYRLEAAGVSHG